MATSKGGPWGNYSGKIGPLIAYIYGDRVILKQRPRPSSKPRTEKQLAIQQRMSVLSPFLNLITLYLRVGFQLAAKKNGNLPNQSAKSYNLKHAVKGVYPNQEIDYPAVRLSEGSLAEALAASVATTDDGFKFTWVDNSSDPTATPYDKTMLMAFFPEKERFFQSIGGVQRQHGEELLQISPELKGQQAETYISFINDDHSAISNSVYTGRIEF